MHTAVCDSCAEYSLAPYLGYIIYFYTYLQYRRATERCTQIKGLVNVISLDFIRRCAPNVHSLSEIQFYEYLQNSLRSKQANELTNE